jgi:hypothetical protein
MGRWASTSVQSGQASTPGHDPELGLVTVPQEFAAELTANHGLHPIQGNCNQHARAPHEYARFRDDLLRGTAGKTAVNLSLLAGDRFDFFLTVYSESHCAGHQCWHLHDVGHARLRPCSA